MPRPFVAERNKKSHKKRAILIFPCCKCNNATKSGGENLPIIHSIENAHGDNDYANDEEDPKGKQEFVGLFLDFPIVPHSHQSSLRLGSPSPERITPVFTAATGTASGGQPVSTQVIAAISSASCNRPGAVWGGARRV